MLWILCLSSMFHSVSVTICYSYLIPRRVHFSDQTRIPSKIQGRFSEPREAEPPSPEPGGLNTWFLVHLLWCPNMFHTIPSPYNRHLRPECICRPCAFRQIIQSQGCGACIPQYRWSLKFILFSYGVMPEYLFHHFFPYAGPNRPYVQIDLIAWIRGMMLKSHGMTDIDMVFICPPYGMNHAYEFPARPE